MLAKAGSYVDTYETTGSTSLYNTIIDNQEELVKVFLNQYYVQPYCSNCSIIS